MKILPWAVSAMLACVLIVAGCAADPRAADPNYSLPPVRSDSIGRLAVSGPNAHINNKPAFHGSYVFSGDTITTGAGTSAMLVLNDGGTIQLDQNTDPLFTLLQEGACLVMEMAGGQAAIETKAMCVELISKRLRINALNHSVVNYRIAQDEASITVIEGRLEMRSPRPALLGPGERYIATIDGATDVQRLTPADAAAVGAWRQKYFPAAQPQQGGLSNAEKGALAVGAAALLYQLFGRGSDRPAAPQPGATAGAGPVQATDSGWCCPPAGPGYSSNPNACRGTFHPGATNSNVCRRPSTNVQ